MDKIKVMQFILHFMILEKKVSSLTLHTEDVVIKQEDNSFTLNCTYHNISEERINDRSIGWQYQIDGTFKNVAYFSPPGREAPYFLKEMEHLYKNRTELIGPNTSLSAVMIIKDPVCTDEGTYRCWIEYFFSTSSRLTKNVSSVVVFNTRATKPKEFLVFPNEIEENQSITIHCIADVGSPQGYIEIWKKTEKSNTPEVIYKSTLTNGKTENCTDLINVTTTYNITRGDNGALFRCSSKNNFTKDPIPSSDSSKISVFYGPDKPTITLTPQKTIYSIGDPLTIQCITESNPPPVFTWIFKPHNKSGDTRVEYSNNKSKMVFSSLKAEDSGIYICMVNNSARPHILNSSAYVSVVPKISEREYSGCNQCGYIEICQQSNQKTVCVYNFWMPIAVVCILLSAVFAVSSIVMVKQRKKTQESTTTSNISIENKSPPSDATPGEMHGGYISPEDLEFGCLPPSVTQEGKGVAYSRL